MYKSSRTLDELFMYVNVVQQPADFTATNQVAYKWLHVVIETDTKSKMKKVAKREHIFLVCVRRSNLRVWCFCNAPMMCSLRVVNLGLFVNIRTQVKNVRLVI